MEGRNIPPPAWLFVVSLLRCQKNMDENPSLLAPIFQLGRPNQVSSF